VPVLLVYFYKIVHSGGTFSYIILIKLVQILLFMTCTTCGSGILYATDPVATCANGVAVNIDSGSVPGECDGISISGTCISSQTLIVGGVAAVLGVGALAFVMMRNKKGGSRR
jgi:hypothetical protein